MRDWLSNLQSLTSFSRTSIYDLTQYKIIIMIPSNSQTNLLEVIRLFLRLGFTAFGGPAAHIAMMRQEVVERLGWMSDQHFLDLVGATNLIPGPNSTEMTIHIGYERAGWRGLLAAGLCFILPAAVMVAVLAWLYVEYGATPQGNALLYGIKPVIIAIILQALVKLGGTAVKNNLLLLTGIGVFLLYLLGINELLLLFGATLLYFAIRQFPHLISLLLLPFPALPPSLAESTPITLNQLFLVFLKAGGLLYGSGYVLLAFLRNDLVVRLGWLTDQQLLDAISVGQFTPGPVFTTATFIGYLLAGLPGAIIATLAIFLPSFVFVALLNPWVPRLRQVTWTSTLLDGVNMAALGLMAGVLWQLAQATWVDGWTVGLTAVSLLLLFRTKINSAWLVVIGGLLGLLLTFLL